MHEDINRFAGEGLAFDDVLLVPAYSEVLPRQTDISTSFSRNIQRSIPLVSAAKGNSCEK